MYNNLEQTPTPQLMAELAVLEKDIGTAIIRYEYIRQELLRRYPQLEQEPAFSEPYNFAKTR